MWQGPAGAEQQQQQQEEEEEERLLTQVSGARPPGGPCRSRWAASPEAGTPATRTAREGGRIPRVHTPCRACPIPLICMHNFDSLITFRVHGANRTHETVRCTAEGAGGGPHQAEARASSRVLAVDGQLGRLRFSGAAEVAQLLPDVGNAAAEAQNAPRHANTTISRGIAIVQRP